MLKVFVGYDPREAIAYHVFCQSVLEHASEPVAFIPLRGERRDGSNDFIYARFMVPHLCGRRGWAMFADGDMIARGDVAEVFALADPKHAVSVVRRPDYETKHPTKYLGNKNENYPRKNWSSVILWNCGHPSNAVLDPVFVQANPGSFLHRFQWLCDDEIGDIPREWNRLVLEEPVSVADKLLHYTIGTPCFDEFAECDAAGEWWQTFGRAIAPCD